MHFCFLAVILEPQGIDTRGNKWRNLYLITNATPYDTTKSIQNYIN